MVTEENRLSHRSARFLVRAVGSSPSRLPGATAGQRVRIAADGSKKVDQVAESGKVQQACRPDDWNELVVIGKGTRLVQKINGVVFAELIDEDAEDATRAGVLAFQDHGRGTIAGFKNIWLKRAEK